MPVPRRGHSVAAEHVDEVQEHEAEELDVGGQLGPLLRVVVWGAWPRTASRPSGRDGGGDGEDDEDHEEVVVVALLAVL